MCLTLPGTTSAVLNKVPIGLRDKHGKVKPISRGHIIESGGHFVLGQTSPDAHNNYNLNAAYVGK